jgi:hypothetical protein
MIEVELIADSFNPTGTNSSNGKNFNASAVADRFAAKWNGRRLRAKLLQ